MPGDSTKRYPPELKQRAVRMVTEIVGQHDSEWAAMGRVDELVGVGTAETVRKWVRQSEVDAGVRTGTVPPAKRSGPIHRVPCRRYFPPDSGFGK